MRSGSGEQAKSFLDLHHGEPISKARTHSLYTSTWAQAVEVICDLKQSYEPGPEEGFKKGKRNPSLGTLRDPGPGPVSSPVK